MADKPKASDFRKQIQDQVDSQKMINDLTREEMSTLDKIFNVKKSILSSEKDYYEKVDAAAAKAKAYQAMINEANEKGQKIHHMTIKALQKEIDKDKEMLALEQKKVNLKLKALKLYEGTAKAATSLWGYLMKSDKVIRSTNIALGLSGTKAEMMRKTFEDTAVFVTSYGGSLEDIGVLMTSFADETGRARILGSQMVKDGMLIAQATGMGAEAAGRMSGQFELMGMNMSNTADYVEGVMETSERMGVNSNKVFKVLSSNFLRLQKTTFQGGVKAMAKMAQYSEKFKMDMGQTLDSAEKARTLEGAIDMMSQLQVMGGKFAQADPFEMLYLSRNAPDKYIEKIGDMTKGMAHFKQMSDGTFQSFISPADIDRIKFASKALGVDEATLTQTTRRMGEIQEMRKRMTGMGLSAEQKEVLEGMYTFDSRLNKFSVEIGGVSKDVTSLTSDELKMLKGQKASLEERAASALTFDETLKATLQSLKAILLPMLQGVNAFLEKMRPTLTKIVNRLADFDMDGFKKGAGWFLTAALALKALFSVGGMFVRSFIQAKVTKRFGGAVLNQAVGTAAAKPLNAGAQRAYDLGQANRAGTMGRAAEASGRGRMMAGRGNMMSGAGIGMAAAGVGAGIGAAAAGISLLANAMTKLDEKKVEALRGIVRSISIMVGIGAAAAAAVMIFGQASLMAAPGLGALSLAVLGIGAGIGIAAAGIGLMGVGLSKLVGVSKGAGTDMLKIGGGIALIAASLALFGNPLSLLGMAQFAAVMGIVSIASLATASAAHSFEKMGIAMKGTKDDWIAVQNAITAISAANFKGGGMLTELANLMKKPLKVEFADDEVGFTSNVTLEIDGAELLRHVDVGQIGLTQNFLQKKGNNGAKSIRH